MAEDKALARFFYEAVIDKDVKKKDGKIVYKNVEFVQITVPDDKNIRLIAQATDEHRQRFPLAYEHFKNSIKRPQDGTPLTLVPIFTPADIETLRMMKIETLEKFCGLAPDKVPSAMKKLHSEASNYLDASNDKAVLARRLAALEEECELEKLEKSELTDLLNKASAEIEALKKTAGIVTAKKAEKAA